MKIIGLRSDRHCPSFLVVVVSPGSASGNSANSSHHKVLGFAPRFGFAANLTLLYS